MQEDYLEPLPYMPSHPGDISHGAPALHQHPHGRLISVIQDCEAVCEHMTTHVTMRPDLQARKTQLLLLRDCADICTLTAKYVARMSQFARMTGNLCAHICEVCGQECLKYPDPESQHCALVCLHCARECRVFAAGM